MNIPFMKPEKKAAVFIDKDGTLIPDIPYNVDADLITVDEATGRGLQQIKQLGYLLIVVSNQPGIALGYFEETELGPVRDKIKSLLAPYRTEIDGFYYCPHHPQATRSPYAQRCACRKPQAGLILKAAHDFDIDLGRSWMIGDILHDVEAGKKAGCQTILVNNGNETEWQVSSLRIPDYVVRSVGEAAAVVKACAKKHQNHERLERL